MKQLFQPRTTAWIGRTLAPSVGLIGLALLLYGLYNGLFIAPADFRQGDAARILYIHVPAAWLALGIYAAMAVSAGLGLVTRLRMAQLFPQAAVMVGAAMTLICLITGSIWGKAIWGAWWVWDARLTSVFLLLLLYLGYQMLSGSAPVSRRREVQGAFLLLIGALNLPIIKYSVIWWTSLHQPASLSSIARMANPAMPPEMLTPLLLSALGLALLCAALITIRLNTIMRLYRQHNRRLRSERVVKEMVVREGVV